MAIKGLSLKESMNKFVQAIMPLDDEKLRFEKYLTEYLNHLKNNKTESEEYQKNLLKHFLEQVLPYNFINWLFTMGRHQIQHWVLFLSVKV